MTQTPSLLGERDFLHLWGAQSVSAFGARITREGLPMMAVLTMAASPAALGLLAAIAGAGGLVASLGSGGFVDRSRRRPILIAADLGRAAALLTIPIAAWLHVLTLPQVYIIAAVVAGASALFDIADHAYLPTLVGRERVLDANTRLGTTEGAAEMAGPALAGVLFQWLSAPIAVLFNSVTYLVSALVVSGIRAVEPKDERPARTGVISGLAEGARIILGSPLARVLLFSSGAGGLFGGFFSALYILFVLRTLGLGPVVLGLGVACGGLGSLVGAVLAPQAARVLGIGPSIILCSAGSALGTMILLFAPAHRPGEGLMFLLGQQVVGDLLGVIPLILGTSVLQSIVAGKALGRVRSVFQATSGLAAVVGALIGGAMGQAFGVRETLFVAVGGLLIGPLVSAFTNLRSVRVMP